MTKIEIRTDSAKTAAAADKSPIVCVSGLIWDEHWSNQQQIMSRLAKTRRILYVDRAVSLLSFFTGSTDAPVGRQFWRWLGGGLREECANLAVLTPPPCLPLRYNLIVNKINGWIRARTIRKAMKKLDMRAPLLCVYEPDAGGIIGKLGEIFSLYYCADDWAASDQWWNNADDIRAREEELASKVDLIVGTSRKIAKRWESSGLRTELISNGADVESFKTARSAELVVPEDLMSIPTPRVGYVGFIDGRFDTQLYEHLADVHPYWQFVVVGPLMTKSVDLSRLKNRSNVHFLGPRSRSELPAYLKGFDVCTIPYVRNTLTESVFPLKLFEYLAAGKPVVTTSLPELEPFKEHVRIASSANEFAQLIDRSLKDPLPAATQDFLNDNSWDSKAKLLSESIFQVMVADGRLMPDRSTQNAFEADIEGVPSA